MTRFHIYLILLALIGGLNVKTRAVEFAGGTGQPDDPYQIATPAQLIAIGQDPNLQDKHFVLVSDLDMDPNLPGGRLLNSSLILTTGSLDGAGHRIFNLTLELKAHYGEVSVLFESIGYGAIVRNLSLEDVFISSISSSEVGMLAHKNEGNIVGCSVEGELHAYAGGGLVAENYGVILNCSVAGTVDVENSGGLAGINFGTIMYGSSTAQMTGGSGLVGENYGIITACWATGDIANGPAGLVENNSGLIRYCYATGDVMTSGELAGGLVGTNSGEISQCYATGDVWAEDRAAGLVANNEGTITHCYATGSGGVALVAVNETNGAIMSCYALAESDGGGVDDGFGVVLTDKWMRRQQSFIEWDFIDTRMDGSLDCWMMSEQDGYPVLTPNEITYAGAGTTEDPYIIETYPQFLAISRRPEACYDLDGDIDLDGLIFPGSIIPMFWGSLDGTGHNIFDFTLTGERGIGLFGTIQPGASVMNLHLHKVRVKTMGQEQREIAALAGCNRGTVIGCSATAEMMVFEDHGTHCAGGLIGVNDGGDIMQCSAELLLEYQLIGSRGSLSSSGGLVGENRGRISQCHALVFTDTQSDEFGGLVARNEGSVVDCFSEGCINGSYIGGLIYSNSGNINNCYTAATVLALRLGDGLVAENSGGNISSSYFLAEADGGGADNGFGTALSDDQMRRRDSFEGWDFDEIWTICEGVDYPRLRWEGVMCDER